MYSTQCSLLKLNLILTTIVSLEFPEENLQLPRNLIRGDIPFILDTVKLASTSLQLTWSSSSVLHLICIGGSFQSKSGNAECVPTVTYVYTGYNILHKLLFKLFTFTITILESFSSDIIIHYSTKHSIQTPRSEERSEKHRELECEHPHSEESSAHPAWVTWPDPLPIC